MEHNTITELTSLLNNIESAKTEFEKWQSKHHTIVQDRLQWVRQGNRDVDQYNSAEKAAHAAKEPGLDTLPAVVAARKRLDAAKQELREAQAAVADAEGNGTPLSNYIDALSNAETLISGLAAGAARQRKLELMESVFGTTNSDRLSRDAMNNIRFRPEVAKLEAFRYTSRLDGLDGAIGEAKLASTHASIVDAAGRLKALLAK
jgi:hypothetical protein